MTQFFFDKDKDFFRVTLKEFYPCINFSYCESYVFINKENPFGEKPLCAYCDFVLTNKKINDTIETKQTKLNNFFQFEIGIKK